MVTVHELLSPNSKSLLVITSEKEFAAPCSAKCISIKSCAEFAVEPLLNYALDSGDVLPSLATSCEPNEDSTVWTCFLREGVKFHDGSDLDANDVVASWAAGIDAANPSHVGTTGSFDYYSYLWDGLMNADQ